ncbi:xanthine dehydrogenase family protein molybdopterin-binding subunit [Phytohabitans sp. ZYX-F-186]|uniref:Xanthine dehydrogenase family protein molybdopterin-binding subunit n=1 Tax=Phytohabitans maris TaxID=3071409 RepID=A0ABU0ZC39_9ACTN|nr:xanthine dehydrogenase family protein molybdopterin-binding subunit [Phytohabitans sp. ZYX-F-186]MDQ7904634.1 xanthine dehydrogenase family protein molybdopterin-binding subunit [Phytohabitans sp. ZYX-F-186]
MVPASAGSSRREPALGAVEQTRRKHGDQLLVGRGGYLDDHEPPGTLHAAILRSPHPHARIRSVDASAARRCRSVRAVVTGAEALSLAEPLPHFFDPSLVGGRTTTVRVLAVDKVRYVGDPVAAVVADSLADAEAALDAIDVDYEILPAVVDAEDALAEGAPTVFDEWGDNVLIRFPFAEGDPARALAMAPHVIADEIRIQRYQTAPMEPRGYLAHWEPTGKLTLYASTQIPHPLRTNLSTIFGLSEDRIRVVATRLGGAFGHKFNGYPEEPLVCLLSRMTGAPVKWVETRADSLLVGAREYIHRFSVGFDDDGRILAITDRIIGNIGCLATWGGWSMTYPAGMTLPGPYLVSDYDIESIAVVTNKAPWNGARGYGKESATVAIERMVDLVAAELGMDPVEVRRRNLIPPERFPHWTVAKHLDSGDYRGALDKVVELAGYHRQRELQRDAREQGRTRGVGVAFELTPEGGDFAGSYVRGFDTSTVRVSPSGAVTVLTGVTSLGTGSDTGIAALVARELGLTVDAVSILQGDTDSCPYGFGNFSARSLATGGGAAVLAAREVRERMALAAGVLLDTPPEGLVFAGGHVHTADGGRSIAFGAVAEQVYRRAYAVPGLDQPLLEATKVDRPRNLTHQPDEHGRMSAYPTFPYSTHVAVVDVDAETGQVRLLDYTCVEDCGVQINPRFVASQIYGAIAMGVGGALFEELPYDSAGQPLARTFTQYLVPRANDLPAIRLDHQCTPSPYTLLGTKGAGQSGVGGAAASLASAVNDALAPLGVRITTMPLSPPTVLRAIRSGGKP